MNRIIKFRAWNKLENRMEHEGHFHFDKDGIVGLEQGVNWWGRPNLITLQFTGLHDKNGKEIFEGDILFNGLNKGEVIWDVVDVDDFIRGWSCLGKNGHIGWNTPIIIIGNKFENPDLMEGK